MGGGGGGWVEARIKGNLWKDFAVISIVIDCQGTLNRSEQYFYSINRILQHEGEIISFPK